MQASQNKQPASGPVESTPNPGTTPAGGFSSLAKSEKCEDGIF